MQTLKAALDAIADQPFHCVQQLRGRYVFPRFELNFIRMQGSPGANPASIASVNIALAHAKIPALFLQTADAKLAVADFLIRRFRGGIDRFAQQNRGKDGSGSFNTIALSQKMLHRDSVLFDEARIQLRFSISLPAKGQGGVVDAEQAWIMLAQELTAMVDATFFYPHYDPQTQALLRQFVEVLQTRAEIIRFMRQQGLVVFIANGAILPRHSGIDDRPASGDFVNAFQAPATLQVTIPLPDGRSLSGMGIKQGITCITGGGYHGKSTLMQAILAGVYAHIPGDGREYVVTRDDAFFIRAEEGRSIRNVDISAFISDLPNGLKTADFSSDNASGSTSQAAAIVEAIDSGSRLLLFDEDTCATNFLVRDELIKKILDAAQEPIKPLYATVRSLWQQHQVSMIFVVGGLGYFLQKADTCLLMEHYLCRDITGKVRDKLGPIAQDEMPLGDFAQSRYLAADNFNPAYINRRLNKTLPQRIKDLRNAPKQLEYGMDLLNLEAVAQIAEAPQLLAIGYCLLALRTQLQQAGAKAKSLRFWIDWLESEIGEHGLEVLKADYPGHLSMPRKYEIAAAINRIRSLKLVLQR
ncbi:MAG: ABC-ATPase domain-containing protein [Methylobacter sp.]|nr:ABC-ATPase domain-containing protein [Methylobacter sp.]MDP2098860.1 ABC-ATPase domain-containing protein [Methylobacter sp.]MDP2428148.1 ABC-ATPase domain-containing protein [Methylobacter sp.]MDP3054384.1 ABC-ATPase domain-containing protein [Methylobacter sp.]MDP3362504.1 ABC-ATPase domain-containing protein [Methylobacter sp.]